MKIIEKDNRFGPRKAYSDVDPKYLEFKNGIRVLPAPFFEEDQKTMFEFIQRHEPGTQGWLEGGYEVRGPGGEFRAYYFDQLILHPEVIKRRYGKNIVNNSDKKRGRPSGIITEKLVKITSGKRGRPSIPIELRKNKPYIPNGLPRGRRKKID